MGCANGKKYMPVAGGGDLRVLEWINTSRLNDVSEAAFENVRVLGKGKFGIVYLAKSKETGTFVAIKYIPKDIIFESKATSRIRQELYFASTLRHPFIIDYFGEFSTDTCIAMVLRYAGGGEFFTRMKTLTPMPEPQAMFYFSEIALTLRYLHDSNVVYRDLKPENILLDENGHIKLCDFGFAALVGKEADSTLTDGCGTAMYVAPEIAGGFNKGHSFQVDWWGLGVILFEMLTGQAPFGDTETMSKFEVFNNINSKSVSFPMSVSSNVKSLVQGLLIKEPLKRFGWKAVAASPWLAEINWDDVLHKRIIAPWVPKLSGPGDSRNFVDWPKVSLPATKPTKEVEKYCQGIISNRSAGPNPPVPLTHSSTIMHIQVPPQNAAASLQRRHSKASHVKPQVLDANVSEENKQILDASLLRALDDVDRADKIKPSGGTRDDNKLGNGDKPQKRSIQRRNTVSNAKV